MNAKPLYEEDFHAWALEQARALRSLRPGAPMPNALDLEHVAEEVEDLGNAERAAVESNLQQAFVHFLKVATSPGDQAELHRLPETAAFLDTAARKYRPSMRRLLDMQAIWADARRVWRRDRSLAGEPVRTVPGAIPFSLDELIDPEADIRALAARLAAQTGEPPAA